MPRLRARQRGLNYARHISIDSLRIEQAPPINGWQSQLDQLGYWVLASVILLVAVYGPFIAGYFPPRLTTAGPVATVP
ncbi:hypothetical protein [Candidatus Binatus sp.]|uniref:hypothetical protein n=1 Tax=Candidatus Binatus sp. TaxID=2811406 RepID=UPI003BCCF9C2